MKKLFLTLFCVGLAAPLFADGTNQLTDENARASYAYGFLNGNQWRAQDVGFDPVLFMKGLQAGLAGDTNQMNEAQAREAMQAFNVSFRERMLARLKAEGETFLATNKLTPGIKFLDVALPDGKSDQLQYLVLTPGTGPMPKATDTVLVNYRGTFVNGTEFDSSYKRGQPAKFQVGGVIPGWTAALEHMPVGSKWKVFIPSDLAYGERGMGSSVPPNSALIFEMELIGIQPATPPPAPAAAPAPLTSDIIKVPSAEEMKKGAKIEVIKPEDVPKVESQTQTQAQAEH